MENWLDTTFIQVIVLATLDAIVLVSPHWQSSKSINSSADDVLWEIYITCFF